MLAHTREEIKTLKVIERMLFPVGAKTQKSHSVRNHGKQVKEDVFISNHLKAGAVDIRCKDMPSDEKQAFLDAAAKVKGDNVGGEETKPPHFHVDIDTTVK